MLAFTQVKVQALLLGWLGSDPIECVMAILGPLSWVSTTKTSNVFYFLYYRLASLSSFRFTNGL